MSDFAQRLAALSPQKRALFRHRLGDLDRAGESTVIPPRRGSGRVLATPFQEELWLSNRLHGGSPVYNLPFFIRLREHVSLEALDSAVTAIVGRHEILRTAFLESEGHVWQEVVAPFSPEVVYIDLRRLAREARADALRHQLEQDAAAPFMQLAPPLLRVTALCVDDADWVIAVTFHHIVADAGSGVVFEQELRTLLKAFSGRESGQPAPLPLQYADYADWLSSADREPARQRSLEYWQTKLSDATAPTRLNVSSEGPANRSLAGALEYFWIRPAIARRVNELSAHGTPFMVLLAVFMVLLHRELGEEDLIIGSPIADRRYRETEPLIGAFLNMVLLRMAVRGALSFREVLLQARQCVLEAMDHQDVTPRQILEQAEPKRRAGFAVPCHITFGVQSNLGQPVPVGSATGNGTSKFDFSLILTRSGDGYAGVVEYRTGLFEAGTVRRLARSFTTLLEAAGENPDTPVAALPLYEASERQALIARHSGPRDEHTPKSFLEGFREQVALSPAAAALSGETALSYAQLDTASNAVAADLLRRQIRKGDRVAVAVERSGLWVTCFLGVLKAGGVYLPLDPTHPPERIEYLARDSGARFMLAREDLACPSWEGIERVAATIRLDGGQEKPVRLEPGDAAYAIYTSGSTGSPKAALLSHAGLAHLVRAQSSAFAPGPGDCILSFCSLSFDASLFELILALAHGATVCLSGAEDLLPGPRLNTTLARTATTILTAPPSLLAAVPHSTLPSLRMVIAAGEPCSAALVDRWQPGRRFFNAYGPTECTIWSTVHECSAGEADPPIGKPIRGMSVFILDEYGNLCPAGAAGELAIAGPMVGLGYLHQPDLTAAAFGADPFSQQAGARLYRSGDRGRLRADGTLEFLGRLDRQIKVRGFRVEPGELELALSRIPGISRAAVVAEPTRGSDAQLIAYVVAAAELEETAIQRALTASVPPFLLPARLHRLADMPHTPNGKTDYKALAAANIAVTSAPSLPLVGEVEEQLADIWREVLRVPDIFADSDFFLLGGHSLLVGRLLVHVSEVFGADLTLKDVFEASQLRRLGVSIQQAMQSQRTAGQSLIPRADRALTTAAALHSSRTSPQRGRP